MCSNLLSYFFTFIGVIYKDKFDLFNNNLIEFGRNQANYEIKVDNHLWEVDVFKGKLDGLIIAEIELSNENEQFTKPEWVIEDVSDNIEYYNSRLIEKC